MYEKTIYFRAFDICRTSFVEITSIENRIPFFCSKKSKTYALNHTKLRHIPSDIFSSGRRVRARIFWEIRKKKYDEMKKDVEISV